MEERKMFRFRVHHVAHGEMETIASDRYFAVTKAAKEWGVRWSTIARDCRVEELGDAPPVKIPKRKEGTAHGKADKKRQRNP